jgi:hypothetical protein
VGQTSGQANCSRTTFAAHESVAPSVAQHAPACDRKPAALPEPGFARAERDSVQDARAPEKENTSPWRTQSRMLLARVEIGGQEAFRSNVMQEGQGAFSDRL